MGFEPGTSHLLHTIVSRPQKNFEFFSFLKICILDESPKGEIIGQIKSLIILIWKLALAPPFLNPQVRGESCLVYLLSRLLLLRNNPSWASQVMMMMVTGNTVACLSRQQALPQAPFTCAWSSARRWFTPGATRRTLALATIAANAAEPELT